MTRCLVMTHVLTMLSASLLFGPAFGQSAIVAENLIFSPPKNFNIGYQSTHDSRQMTEWVAAGESVDTRSSEHPCPSLDSIASPH